MTLQGNQKDQNLCYIQYLEIFLDRWIRIWAWNYKIQDIGSNMDSKMLEKLWPFWFLFLYEFELKIAKFKIRDPIKCYQNNFKNIRISAHVMIPNL